MEPASLSRKWVWLLSGTESHMTVCDSEKLHVQRVRARILIKGKIYKSSRDVASLLKNSNDRLNFGRNIEIIVFKSLLTTFELMKIFLGCSDNS